MFNQIEDENKREIYLQRAENGGKLPHADPSLALTGIMLFNFVLWGIVIASVAASLLHLFYRWIFTDWVSISRILSERIAAIMTSISIVVLGLSFWWLKIRQPFIYGSIEVGTAAITAFDSCIHIAQKGLDGPHWLLAILGSIYIAVRGFDNISKSNYKIVQRTKAKT